MDINNDLQQINSFTGGMNTDSSDSYLKSNEYRIAKNLRCITNTGENTGELHTIDGVDIVHLKVDGVELSGLLSNVISTAVIRNIGIIIGRLNKDNEEDDDTWAIYTFDSDKLDEATCIFGPCKDDIGDDIQCVTRYEDSDNIKLYIACSNYPLLYINIANPPKHNGNIATDIKYISSFPELNLPQIGVEKINGALKPGLV